MTILDKIEDLWTLGMQRRVDNWAQDLQACRPTIIAAVKAFHEWEPLRVYLSFTKATSSTISFSLRYQGQQVATLIVKNKNDIQLETAKSNNQYFRNLPNAGIQKFSWRSVEATKFRKYFNNPTLLKPLRSLEHRIESEFLKQMSDKTSGKFAGTLKNIQPVLLTGCPFQFPLPISGYTGIPKHGNGNIDIIARRGTGKGTMISIWELKIPGVKDHAIEQAYIYSVTLLKMLRSKPWGDFWYKNIIGFKGDIPAKLTIESIVAVSMDQHKRTAFESKLQNFKTSNPLTVGNDNIKLCVAYYHYDDKPGIRNPLTLVKDIKVI